MRNKELLSLSNHVFVDETYVNVAKHGELSVKMEVSKNKLRIGVVVDGLVHFMAKVNDYGMPKNRDFEKDLCAIVERGLHVTHDNTNYGHSFKGR